MPLCRLASVTLPKMRSTIWCLALRKKVCGSALTPYAVADGEVRVPSHRIADAVGAGERRRVADGVVLVQSDQRHLALLGAVELGQQRGLGLARIAPGREEVDDERLAPVLAERDLLPGVVAEEREAERGRRDRGRASARALTRGRADHADRDQRPGHADGDDGGQDLVPERRPPDLARRALPRLLPHAPLHLLRRRLGPASLPVRASGPRPRRQGLRASLPSAASAPAGVPGAGPGMSASGPAGAGSSSSNSLPCPGVLCHQDVAAVRPGDRAHQRQPEAGAPGRAAVAAAEPVEDVPQQLGRDALAGVRDDHADRQAVARPPRRRA